MGAILGRTNPDQMWVPDGNASMPGLAFQSEPSLGFYRVSAGIIAMVGGSASFQFPDGTAAAPSITFAADTDTGLYRFATNVIGISNAGALTHLFGGATYNLIHDSGAVIFGLNGDAVIKRGGGAGILTLSNAAGDDFTRLCFGGTTNAYPAIARSGTVLYFKLADDSGNCNVYAGGFSVYATTPRISYGTQGEVNSCTNILKSLTSMADNTAVTIATVTIPNAIHGGSIRVTAVGTLGDGDSTQTVIANIAVSRITGANAKAVCSASAAAAATTGATANATTTVSVTAVSGAAGASNTFDIQIKVARSAGASTNHKVTAEMYLMNENTSGITIA